jgi:hypothetical protein
MHVRGHSCWFRVSRSVGQCRVRTKLWSPIGARCSQLVTGVDRIDSTIDLDGEPGSRVIGLPHVRVYERSEFSTLALRFDG